MQIPLFLQFWWNNFAKTAFFAKKKLVEIDQFANYSQVNLDGTLMEKIVCIQFRQPHSNRHVKAGL